MKSKALKILAFFILATSGLEAIGSDPMVFGKREPEHIEVNNRILAKVNGKGISVIDVMKKLDMVFYKSFPEYAEIVPARHQFYTMHWKDVLKQLVEKELILVDVEELKLPVSNGDVRQEMESLFGPDMIENLDKAGLSFEEAFKMVKGDIAIRRMMMAKVNSKALRAVTPQAVQTAYEEYAKNNIRSNEWIYYVISVRDPEDKDGQASINTIYKILAEDKVPLDQFIEKFKETGVGKKSAINVSQEFRHNDLEVSEIYKDTLFKMEPGTFSKPISQVSRRDKSQVWRVFYLKQVIQGGMIPFSEVDDQIRDNLLEAAIDKETDLYLAKLKTQYSVEEADIKTDGPDGFQPFVLK